MYSLCLFGVVINLIVDMAPDYQENKNSALHVRLLTPGVQCECKEAQASIV